MGLSIPGSFLTGVAILWFMGYTMNIVVLFSLILVVGMLVDGAIVTVELAERRMSDGESPGTRPTPTAAKRMAWPIIASTATTLAVFLPLLFWSGMIGEFMKFLPITVITVLERVAVHGARVHSCRRRADRQARIPQSGEAARRDRGVRDRRRDGDRSGADGSLRALPCA